MFNTTQENNGLHITYKGRGDLVENIARLDPFYWLAQTAILGTPKGIWSSPNEQMADELRDMYKDVEFKGQYEVLLGGNSLATQLRRLVSPDRRMNIFSRLTYGLATTMVSWATSKISRADHYNPFTETAIVYTPSKAVAAHEIGHAEFFDKQVFPSISSYLYTLPIIRSNDEWKASRNAMSHFTEEKDIKQANRLLSSAFATYYISDILTLVGAGSALLLPTPINIPLTTTLLVSAAIGGRVHATLSDLFRGKKNIFNKRQIEEAQLAA